MSSQGFGVYHEHLANRVCTGSPIFAHHTNSAIINFNKFRSHDFVKPINLFIEPQDMGFEVAIQCATRPQLEQPNNDKASCTQVERLA
jgi:hypothetical protein